VVIVAQLADDAPAAGDWCLGGDEGVVFDPDLVGALVRPDGVLGIVEVKLDGLDHTVFIDVVGDDPVGGVAVALDEVATVVDDVVVNLDIVGEVIGLDAVLIDAPTIVLESAAIRADGTLRRSVEPAVADLIPGELMV